MGFFDAELKDSKRRAEEMQQALRFFDVSVSVRQEIVDVLLRAFCLYRCLMAFYFVLFCYFCCFDLLPSLHRFLSCKVDCSPPLSTQAHIYCRLSYDLILSMNFEF